MINLRSIITINAALGYTHEDRQRKTLAIQVGDFAGNDLL